MNSKETGLRRYLLLPVPGRPYEWRKINNELEEIILSQKDWSLARDVVTFFFPHTPDFMNENQEGCLIGRELIGPPKEIDPPFVALDWQNQELDYYPVEVKTWDDLFDQAQLIWEKRAAKNKTESRWFFEWQRELDPGKLAFIGQVAFYS